MKFGKYLASRQLELPEYSGHFIDYKALKKLIKSLAIPSSSSSNIESNLKENKSSFFFRVERELEKVNSFYIEKQSNLIINLDILIIKKKKLTSNSNSNFKNSITYLNLYNSFKKFSQDLKKLELFIELNELGFAKVLKKWDKRSKSHTKELFISTAVNVQPVFHKNEMNDLSDLVVSNLLELESRIDGDFIKYNNDSINEEKDQFNLPKYLPNLSLPLINLNEDNQNANTNSGTSEIGESIEEDVSTDQFNDKEIDELYTSFLNIVSHSTAENIEASISKYVQNINQKEKISKIFQLLVPITKISDSILSLFLSKIKYNIDLNLIDDLTGKNILHECCKLPAGRNFIVDLCIQQNIDLLIKDFNGKTCLHYATEFERLDLIEKILPIFPSGKLDLLDNDSMTPLLLSIKNNNIEILVKLIEHGSKLIPISDDLNLQYLPLNYSCKQGNFQIIAKLIEFINLKESKESIQILNFPDVEGLLPLHVAARNGNFEIIEILIENGADINKLDGLNKWSPIFYSVIGGFSKTTKELIKFGADLSIIDEDGFNCFYYSVFEGNFNILNLLLANEKLTKSQSVDQFESEEMFQLEEQDTGDLQDMKKKEMMQLGMSNVLPSSNSTTNTIDDIENIDSIPDFQLPPPIIPLRRYGHNFLEKKIFIQIFFLPNNQSINLYSNNNISTPGRITLSSSISDIIPRNLLLPINETNNQLTFQIDLNNLDKFSIDFELFPSFGTRLIAKTTSLPIFFLNDKINGDVKLPLFDIRLKNVGELKFKFQIVHPYNGIPLEISKFDTYWKSTSGKSLPQNTNILSNLTQAVNTQSQQQSLANPTAQGGSVLSFVTASSLSGSYIRIKVCLLSDGTPVVCPSWSINVSGISMLLTNLSIEELNRLTNELYDYPKLIKDFSNSNNLKLIEKLLRIIYIPLNDFLKIISVDISINIELLYPSEFEMKKLNFTNKINYNLNKFIDKLLTDIFNHARYIRQENKLKKVSTRTRSFIFSSNNPLICKILNWKQPNYPVFLNIGCINYDLTTNKYESTSINGLKLSEQEITQEINTTRAMKEALKFVSNNNLLGIIVPINLLNLIPDLIKTIRSRGLILIGSKELSNEDTYDVDYYTKTEINGLRFNNVLSFKDGINV